MVIFFCSSGIDLPPGKYEDAVNAAALKTIELPADEKDILSLQAPAEFLIIFERVTQARGLPRCKASQSAGVRFSYKLIAT